VWQLRRTQARLLVGHIDSAMTAQRDGTAAGQVGQRMAMALGGR